MAPRKKAEPPESLQELMRVLPVEWRSMFGGIGIYSEGIFFALISSEGTLYFRVDDTNRPDFEKAGSEPFQFSSHMKKRAGEPIITSYWRVPEKVLEKPATLRKWAEKALHAAQAARAGRKGATVIPAKAGTRPR
jgi:DNA transformation protein